MSRITFDELVVNATTLAESDLTVKDTKGYSIWDWIEYGVIGWDPGLNTFFVQLDLGRDEPVWWFGTEPNQLKSFNTLCQTVNQVFGVADGFFSFEHADQLEGPTGAPSFVGYFFNEEGRYQSRIYLDSSTTCLEMAFRFRDIVPKIMITQSDESILEMEQGQLTHPELDREVVQQLQQSYPPIRPVEFEVALENYHKNISRVESEGVLDASIENRLRNSEYYLMAIAAREGVNLYEYDYKPAEALITELSE